MVMRAWLVVAGQGFMTFLSILLVPQWGLIGFAWAQIGQGFFLLIGSWLLLRHVLPQLPELPRHWNKTIFLEMLSYGANIQLAGLCMMFFDPVTKALMAKFGGPAAAGHFEIANQVVLRARSLIVAANQAIVPKIAEINEISPERLPELYQKNMNMLVLVAFPCFSLLFAWSGIFSQLLLGKSTTQFVFFFHVTVIAWFLNTFNVPAYFINNGTGLVGLNTISNIVIGILNLILGWILGQRYGADGVVWGYVAALVTGSWLLIITFQQKYSISWQSLVFREHFALVAVCLIIFLAGFVESKLEIKYNSYEQWGVVIILPLLLLSIVFWYHPLRLLILERFQIFRSGK
jgi:O-antigen/teichoic acid export membrane protein